MADTKADTIADKAFAFMGQSLRRKEDPRLLTGGGRYTDDVQLPGMTHAVMIRSPHAHAEIGAIDASDALAMPGVLAVLTGKDAAEDNLQSVFHGPMHSSPPDIPLPNTDGSETYLAPHFPLPADRARHVGEAVAVVVAETAGQAADAAERVVVDWRPIPAVTGTEAAAAADAPRVWDEAANVVIDSLAGDHAAVDAAFEKAAHIVNIKTTLSRVSPVFLEPRAAVGVHDPDTGAVTLYAGSGGAVRQKREISEILNLDIDTVRVIAGDVGGNYGPRNAIYAEYPIVVWAAMRLGRPVKWTGDRSQAFLTDYQARDLVVEAELAVDAEGMFLGLRTSNLSNIGAHPVSFIPLVKGIEIMTATYRMPAVAARARGTMSNTPPTYPYRSAGRPEVIYAMERLIDMAAEAAGVDRLDIRRKNIVQPDEIPYDNRMGMVYDSGDFPEALEDAIRIGDWAGFEARQAEAAARGKKRGIGVGCYIDLSTGAPVERTEITVRTDDEVDVVIGTQSTGQGHETSFGQMVAHLIQAPFDAINLIAGDTALVKAGGGTHSGRSMRMGAVVISEAVEKIIDRGSEIAAHVLEAARSDIEYGGGAFRVAGTDRALSLFDAARAAETRSDLPEELQGPLAADAEIFRPQAAFGSGAHVCEVEIDPETGALEIVNYTAVDDVGRAINPMMIDGQTHGGIAQGAGQALMEAVRFDPETGQAIAASFMDYTLPRADTMPNFKTLIQEVPAPSNPLGVKPGSEGGTAPAVGVIANAIVDALSDLGVRHIEVPATPLKVWQSIQDAQNG